MSSDLSRMTHIYAGNPLDRGDLERRDEEWLSASAKAATLFHDFLEVAHGGEVSGWSRPLQEAVDGPEDDVAELGDGHDAEQAHEDDHRHAAARRGIRTL